MLPELTTDIEQILARQILSIEEVTGYLARTVIVGDDETNQYLVLVFADGRWAFILPRNNYRGFVGVHIAGKYLQEHNYYNHSQLTSQLTILYEAGLFTEEQWVAHLDLQQRQRAEHARLEAMAAQQRQQDNARAKEAAEERRRKQLDEEFYKALRLKYGDEATDRGLKQMRAARKRRESQASSQ